MKKLLMREKPYPVGYEAPSVAGYYMEKPTLSMTPFMPLALEKTGEALPQTLILRARVVVQRAVTWPVFGDPSGTQWSLGQDDLYTEEGANLKDQARVLSLSLLYTGFCAIPGGQGVLLPWNEAGDLLPYAPGVVLFHHAFAFSPPVIPLPASDTSVLQLFPLGGCLRHPLSPLSTTPLYFFTEPGASPPNVRLLFWSDVAALKANPRGPVLVFPEGLAEDPYLSPEAALLCGALKFTVQDTSYQSVHVNPVAGDGTLVDVVLRSLTVSAS